MLPSGIQPFRERPVLPFPSSDFCSAPARGCRTSAHGL
jgi:hypothetical protein